MLSCSSLNGAGVTLCTFSSIISMDSATMPRLASSTHAQREQTNLFHGPSQSESPWCTAPKGSSDGEIPIKINYCAAIRRPPAAAAQIGRCRQLFQIAITTQTRQIGPHE